MTTLREKRIEAGRKGGLAKKDKGTKKTLLKEEVFEVAKQRVFAMTQKLVNAQSIVAVGTHKMVRTYKDASGMPHTEVIRDTDRMQELIDTGEYGKDYMILIGAEPDHKAASALLDRFYGKPTESIEIGNKDNEPFIIILDE